MKESNRVYAYSGFSMSIGFFLAIATNLLFLKILGGIIFFAAVLYLAYTIFKRKGGNDAYNGKPKD